MIIFVTVALLQSLSRSIRSYFAVDNGLIKDRLERIDLIFFLQMWSDILWIVAEIILCVLSLLAC